MDDEALHEIAVALDRLGTNDAATSMGALEVLAMEHKEGAERIAEALREGLGGLETTDDLREGTLADTVGWVSRAIAERPDYSAVIDIGFQRVAEALSRGLSDIASALRDRKP